MQHKERDQMEHADFAGEYVDHFLSGGGIPSPGVNAEVYYTHAFIGPAGHAANDAAAAAAAAALLPAGVGVVITAEEIADVGRRYFEFDHDCAVQVGLY
jgi:hypothetical protein